MEATNSIAIGPECLRNISQKSLAFLDIDSEDMYFDICFVYRLDNNNPAGYNLFVTCSLELRVWDLLNVEGFIAVLLVVVGKLCHGGTNIHLVCRFCAPDHSELLAFKRVCAVNKGK